jgi:cell division protein FtsB
MKRLMLLAIATLLCCLPLFSQKLSKEEKKKLKDDIKSYNKDLAGYKKKMDDIKAAQDASDAEIKRLKDELDAANAKKAELESQVTTYDAELKSTQQENETLKADATKYVDMKNAPNKGTVYKVQIGFYKKFNINKYFEDPRYIGYEDVDGMNRYIISYFPDEKIAKDFVTDIRKMGIKDAFVSKYIDGQRVYEWSQNPKYKGKKVPATLEEAIGTDKKATKKK